MQMCPPEACFETEAFSALGPTAVRPYHGRTTAIGQFNGHYNILLTATGVSVASNRLARQSRRSARRGFKRECAPPYAVIAPVL